MAHASVYFRNDFDGAIVDGVFPVWPDIDFVDGNPPYGHPVVDGSGFGISNRYQRVLWRGRSTNSAGTGDYKCDLTAKWENAGGAQRSLGCIVRFKDWDNLIVARLQSNIGDSPTLKLYKRIAGVETQLGSTYTGTPLSAANMNAGLTFRVRIEDLKDGTGETSIKVYTSPVTTTSNGDVRITWTGDLPELRGPYTVGVELGATVGGDDISVDSFVVYDFADEPNLSGVTAEPGTGWVVQLDDTQYPIDSRTGGLQGLTPPVEFVGCAQSLGTTGSDTATFKVLGDYREGLLRPGMRVKCYHDGDVRFDGVMVRGTQAASPEEAQDWEAKSGLYGAVNVQIVSDSCENQIFWNVDPENTEEYDEAFAEKTIGEIITYLLERYRAELASYGAAPTDGTPCFVTEELQSLDGIIPGMTTSGNVLNAVQSCLQFMPTFQVFFDPQTRVWHFRDVSAQTEESIGLTDATESVRFNFNADTESSCYTAVVFQGVRKEQDTDLTLGINDRGWNQAQEDNFHDGKRHKSAMSITTYGFGYSTGDEPGLVWCTVLASAGLQEDDWRGSLASGLDGFDRIVVHNTSTRIYMAAPTWGGGSPPVGHPEVHLSYIAAGAMRELAAGMVGQVFFLPPVEIDGETSCNYNPRGMNLLNGGFCGEATVSGTGADGAQFSQAYYYKVQPPTDAAFAAGFCKPMAVLAQPIKLPMGIINSIPQDDGGGGFLGGTGAGSVSTLSPDNVGGGCSASTKYQGITVTLKIPTTKTCAPRLRVPAEGWRGTAFSEDTGVWDGAGDPAGTDWGVRRELIIPLSEYTSHDMDAGLTAAANSILALTGQKPRSATIDLATPWRTWHNGIGSFTGSLTSRWAGLENRVTLTSTKRSTGFETAPNLHVHSVRWNVRENTTVLEAGTAAGWIGGNYGVIVESMLKRDATLKTAKMLKQLEDFRNKTLGKDVTRLAGAQGGPTSGCDVQVFDSNTKKVTNINEKAEVEQEQINHAALAALGSSIINQGAEPSHPGAKPEVPGLSGDETKQITSMSGPEGVSLADHRIPFMGPVGGAKSRYGGLLGMDNADTGRAPEVLFTFGGYALVKKPNANATNGGGIGVQLAPLDEHGNLTSTRIDFHTPMDFPEGRAPLDALNTYSIQHQLKLRDDDLAKQLGAVQDAVGAIQSPGDRSTVYPDGAPANVASILRTAGLLGNFRMVPETWNDPAGPVFEGPMKEDGVNPGTFWRIMVPENIFCRVEKTGTPGVTEEDGGGTNGSTWVYSAGVHSSTSVVEYLASSSIVHKNFSGPMLDWDKRYAPADSMTVATDGNPFGAEGEESLRLGATPPGSPSGVTVAFDVPPNVRAAYVYVTTSEDPNGAAVSAGETYYLRIDTAFRASPWGTVNTGTATAGMTGDGSNTGTGQFKAPAGAVPAGLRAVGVAGVYLPGTGTAPAGASIGVIGIGVDLALIDGGALLRVRRTVAADAVLEEAPWTSDVIGGDTELSFEATKGLESGVECFIDVGIELNPA